MTPDKRINNLRCAMLEAKAALSKGLQRDAQGLAMTNELPTQEIIDRLKGIGWSLDKKDAALLCAASEQIEFLVIKHAELLLERGNHDLTKTKLAASEQSRKELVEALLMWRNYWQSTAQDEEVGEQFSEAWFATDKALANAKGVK